LATYKGVYSLTLTAKHGTVSLSNAQVITLNIVDQCDSPTINKPLDTAVTYVMDGKEVSYPIAKITNVLSKIHLKPKACTFTYTVTVPAELKKVATYDASKGIKVKSAGGVKKGIYKLTVQAKVGTTVMTNGKYTMSITMKDAPKKNAAQLTLNTFTNAATVTGAGFVSAGTSTQKVNVGKTVNNNKKTVVVKGDTRKASASTG